MRLKYVGPLEGVEIPELGNLVVARDEIIDVDDADIAKRLALSADWQVTSKTNKREGD